MKRQIMLRDVKIGGGAPLTIQSMTNTPTADVKKTMEQIDRLVEAGCEIIRLAVPDMEAAQALGQITRRCPIPVVADIHFDYRLAIASMEAGVDKIRINPGNMGDESQVKQVVDMARQRHIPIRVGVNSGSLEKRLLDKYGGVTADALAESAMDKVHLLERFGFEDIVISLKSSNVRMNDEAYRIVDRSCDYPLHIGVTEAGTPARGRIKSAAGLGALILSGIGDTMRVSLTADPVEEVIFARQLLAALDIRREGIEIVSCPTCGRTQVDLETMIARIEEGLQPLQEEMRRSPKKYRKLKLAVMGCVVNGPGEAREADLGVACGKGKGVIIMKGETVKTVSEEDIPEELTKLARKYAENTEGIDRL